MQAAAGGTPSSLSPKASRVQSHLQETLKASQAVFWLEGPGADWIFVVLFPQRWSWERGRRNVPT